MNTAVYQKKKLTFESTRKKVDSVGTTAVSYIVFMNTSSSVSAPVFMNTSSSVSAPVFMNTSSSVSAPVFIATVWSSLGDNANLFCYVFFFVDFTVLN